MQFGRVKFECGMKIGLKIDIPSKKDKPNDKNHFDNQDLNSSSPNDNLSLPPSVYEKCIKLIPSVVIFKTNID